MSINSWFPALMLLSSLATGSSASLTAQQIRIVASSDDSSAVRVTRTTPQVSITLRIFGDNARAVDSLRVTVSPLLGPNSVTVKPTWTLDGKPGSGAIALPAQGSADLEIDALMPQVGTYTGQFVFFVNGRRETRSLIVKRELGVLPIKASVIHRLRSYYPGRNPRAGLSLQDTAGAARWIDGPTLTDLSLDAGGGLRDNATNWTLTVRDDAGRMIHDSLLLPGLAARRIEVTLPKLSRAGEYTGNLVVTARDSRALLIPFTLLVKHAWVVAALLIGFGVFGSDVLRSWRQVTRPRLVRVRHATALSTQVEEVIAASAGAPEGIAAFLTEFRGRITALESAIQNELEVDPRNDALLIELDTKVPMLPAWVALSRRVARLEPAALRGPFEAELDSAAQYLRSSPVTNEATKRIQDSLASMDDRITKAVRDALVHDGKALREQIEQELKARANEPGNVKLFEAWITGLKSLEEPSVAEHLEEGRVLLNKVRRGYAKWLAAELFRRFEDSHVPPGFTQNRWDTLRGKLGPRAKVIAESEESEEQIRDYRELQTEYLRGLAEGLTREMDGLTIQIPRLNQLRNDEKLAFAARVKVVGAQTARIVASLDAGQTASAAALYQEAVLEIRAVLKELAKKGLAGSLGASAPATWDVVPPASVPEELAAPGEERPLRLSQPETAVARFAGITAFLRSRDRLFALVVGAIAILLGLQLLWVPDATWGGWPDGLTAVLWGLGLHQVAGAAIQGPVGVSTSFDRP